MLPVSDYKLNNSKKTDLNLVGKIKVKFLIFFTLIIIALFFTQLVFASNLAVDGQKLSEVEEQISLLKAQNTTLKVQIAEESSLAALWQKADKIGFQKPAN